MIDKNRSYFLDSFEELITEERVAEVRIQLNQGLLGVVKSSKKTF